MAESGTCARAVAPASSQAEGSALASSSSLQQCWLLPCAAYMRGVMPLAVPSSSQRSDCVAIRNGSRDSTSARLLSISRTVSTLLSLAACNNLRFHMHSDLSMSSPRSTRLVLTAGLPDSILHTVGAAPDSVSVSRQHATPPMG